ncbi:hypothetical protein [Amycolatopsis silviterrae]|uniref:Uncharacterized protein n=1 Tax=Amycolatopsis silviterrae TaxID=1656914 RepID=A0ABW5GZB0_9PSEU
MSPRWIRSLLVAGAVLAFGGLLLVNGDLDLVRNSDTVICGLRTMQPEDRCVEGPVGTSSRELSYEEVKADNAADRQRAVSGIVVGSLGLVLIVSGGIATLAHRT